MRFINDMIPSAFTVSPPPNSGVKDVSRMRIHIIAVIPVSCARCRLLTASGEVSNSSRALLGSMTSV